MMSSVKGIERVRQGRAAAVKPELMPGAHVAQSLDSRAIGAGCRPKWGCADG
jgi:hypothetical protein